MLCTCPVYHILVVPTLVLFMNVALIGNFVNKTVLGGAAGFSRFSNLTENQFQINMISNMII